ncbi:MAG: hypothetical protein MUP52_00810 [Candidatus Aminicenantes bacterium]|nr:hypothetical protein [Candidatus Aminicenantes bacterium]
MVKADWKDDLKTCFDDLEVIEKCRAEALKHFNQFCDLIVEPAFEILAEEFRKHRVKVKFRKDQGKSIHLVVRFPKSRVDQFRYILWMPEDSVELKLRLTIKSRKTPFVQLEERTVPFIENVSPKEILQLDKDFLAQDVVVRYKRFLYESAVATE